MNDIIALLTAYRRPTLLRSQLEAVRAQSVPPRAVWLWANQPNARMLGEIDALPFDRVVTCSQNAYMHARFALALLAPAELVAVFDDDSIPGSHWFANCLEVMRQTPGILGSAGVRLSEKSYSNRSLYGWHYPCRQTVEVDLVGHAWFLRREWLPHLFAVPAVVGTNGEDIELSARTWRLGGIRTYCPPHPPDDTSRWGSLKGNEYGTDEAALSRRPTHLQERDRVVRAEIEAGWKPLYLRTGAAAPVAAAPLNAPIPVNAPAPAAASDLAGDGCGMADLVPPSVRRVLEIGCNSGRLARALKARQNVWIEGIAVEEDTSPQVNESFDQVERADRDLADLCFPNGAFDGIVVKRPDMVRDPERLLQQVRDWLTADGCLVARFPNIRHHQAVASLLDGTWGCGSQNLVGAQQVRFFTRREVEKLLYRAGYRIERLVNEPGPGFLEWERLGRPPAVQLGALQIGGLPPDEAEEFYLAGYTVRARPVPRPDYGLTSIIIVTHNELAYTRMCLESIHLHTQEPYELILVDNGSTDGTADFVRTLPGAKFLFNPDNRGFPKAVNQGLTLATGRQVLLLNNDCLVDTGWLRHLLEALYSDDRVGLAGPCSNMVSGEQQVPVTYDDLMQLDGFAWDWAQRQAGLRVDTDRLVGFCLLIRRAVLDQIGGLDERFGIGCFDDDDFCRRALQANYRVVIARDAFVHHFGGCTFRALGIDYNALIQHNQQLFEEKWQHLAAPPGPSVRRADCQSASGASQGRIGNPPYEQSFLDPAPGHQPASAPSPAATLSAALGRFTLRSIPGQGLQLVRKTVKLSLCMIVRDNERTIRAALESIRPWVDEIIVVDTGSTDRTPEIARELGAKVFYFPWCDSFSAARNFSVEQATGEWIFWMDSDDPIDPENGRKLRALLAQEVPANVLGFAMQVHVPDPNRDGAAEATVVDHVKLFRNLPGLRFEQRIHEQILPAIGRLGGDVLITDIFVVHSGYDRSPEGQQKKIERDLRLLHKEFEENPNHTFTLFNLGMTYTDVRQYTEAIPHLRRCLKFAGAADSHVRKAYAFLVICHEQLGQPAEALAVCQEGLQRYPTDDELRFRKGLLLHSQGRLAEAVATYEDLLQRRDHRHYQSLAAGLTGYLARFNLAQVFLGMGDHVRAEAQLRQVVAEQPNYRPGWEWLGETLLRQGQHDQVLALAAQLAPRPTLGAAAALLRSQVHRARGQWPEARRELEEGLARCPDDLALLGALNCLLFEHGPRREAEAVLRRLLRVAPDDASAHHNLANVLSELGRWPEAVAALEQAVALRSRDAALRAQLGQALAVVGRWPEAVRAWQEALQLDPGNVEARAALQKFGAR